MGHLSLYIHLPLSSSTPQLPSTLQTTRSHGPPLRLHPTSSPSTQNSISQSLPPWNVQPFTSPRTGWISLTFSHQLPTLQFTAFIGESVHPFASPTAQLQRLTLKRVKTLGTVLKNATQLLLLLAIVRYVTSVVEKGDPVWFVTAW